MVGVTSLRLCVLLGLSSELSFPKNHVTLRLAGEISLSRGHSGLLSAYLPSGGARILLAAWSPTHTWAGACLGQGFQGSSLREREERGAGRLGSVSSSTVSAYAVKLLCLPSEGPPPQL